MAKHARMQTLVAADFVSHPVPATLAEDEIHLWFYPCGGTTRADRSAAERRLRETLAGYLSAEAASVRIERNAHGKPFLTDAALQFNLSHSGGALLIAISATQALGVDLEGGGRERNYLDIAERFFSPDEAAMLGRLDPARRRDRFVQLWSAKEAVLKALGRGIAFGLDRLSFEFDAEGQLERLARIDAAAGDLAQWNVVRLVPADGLVGALAWHGPAHGLRTFRGSTDFAPAATFYRPAPS
jgi:4'-phosphopantetheinyl transferase